MCQANLLPNLVDGKTNPASFNKLQTVSVYGCHSMKVVFDLEGVDVLNENGAKVIVFAQLHTINIEYLYELTHIWKNAPKEILQLGTLQNLKTLKVTSCYKIKYLLSVSMAKLLVNLQQIELYDCKSMEQVIKIDDEEEEGIIKKMDKIVFPQLCKLYLVNFGLKVFCQGNHDFEFPALEEVLIYDCPNMNNFCSGSVSTPKLMYVETVFRHQYKPVWMGDLNKTVQYHYESSKKYVNEEEVEEENEEEDDEGKEEEDEDDEGLEEEDDEEENEE